MSTLDDRFQESGCVCQVRTDGTGRIVVDSSFVIDVTRSGIMAGWRQAVELAMTSEEIAQLTSVSHSRTERASRVAPARGAPSDGPTLRRTGGGLWPACSARRPTATGQGADDHAGSQSLVGVPGVR